MFFGDLKSADPSQVAGVQVLSGSQRTPIKSFRYVCPDFSLERSSFMSKSVGADLSLICSCRFQEFNPMPRKTEKWERGVSRRFLVFAVDGIATSSMAVNAARIRQSTFCRLRFNKLSNLPIMGNNSTLRRKVPVARLKKALRSGVRHVLTSVTRTG